MMKTKIALCLGVLTTLTVVATAIAEEYKPVKVSYKAKEVKTTAVVEHEVDDYYKFETGMKDQDRTIASEKEEQMAEAAEKSDRTPSSKEAYVKEEGPKLKKQHLDRPLPWYQNGKRESHIKKFSEY